MKNDNRAPLVAKLKEFGWEADQWGHFKHATRAWTPDGEESVRLLRVKIQPLMVAVELRVDLGTRYDWMRLSACYHKDVVVEKDQILIGSRNILRPQR